MPTTKANATESLDAPPVVVSAETPAAPQSVECTLLHGRLTHEGQTYGPGESVFLPAELARGLIAAGHVARKE